MKTKVCSKCGKEKSLDQFHKNKRAPDGRTARCRECRSAGAKGGSRWVVLICPGCGREFSVTADNLRRKRSTYTGFCRSCQLKLKSRRQSYLKPVHIVAHVEPRMFMSIQHNPMGGVVV